MVRALLTLLIFTLASCANSVEIREKWTKKEDGSRFVEIEGTSVHYRDFGEGQAIVLLHGICDSLHSWRHFKKPILEAGYRYIALDVPGFGLTHGKEIPYDQENYTLFLNKLFKKLNIESPIIIGNSLGGYIAWNYAINYPRETKKIVLLSPAGYPLSPPLVVRISENGFLQWIAKNLSTRMSSDFIARGVFYDREKMEEEDLERFYELFNLEGNFDKYMRVFKSIMKLQNTSPDLARLETPTLLIWGENDNWIPFKQTNHWKRDVDHLEFFPLKETGHTPQLERPKKTIQIILNSLKKE
ncbi:hypothetical protein BIY24_09015 [Halobacteriovorax marinus]|uniref:alpha/beta fold hydrolase n=1 Tax=Halobacteriovorax marinus TaxID=97084 RepID=UPI000BC2CD2A|nr:alpha/beta hydrolase [Halobacteriovorax marinus]ATH08084.1 hypothetical protein BIY24_09015 [Halobacteriovorax marinus]